MPLKFDQLLQTAKEHIAAGKFNAADSILVTLKNQHPLSKDVARLWCSLAMRTGRAAEVPVYAETIYAQVESDFHKAHWAHVLGTAQFMLLDLSASRQWFVDALNRLMALAKAGKIPPQKQHPNPSQSEGNAFASGKAEDLLWQTCAHLAHLNIPAFPYAGTLLGLVRNNRLLEFDKDLDIAVWTDRWHSCCDALEQAGWVRAPMRIEYANYRDYVHPEWGITIDVCGLHREQHRITGGFALPDFPEEYQRVSVFPIFGLTQRSTGYGPVWFPCEPEKLLHAFYGDWHTPNPHWDTVVSAHNLEKFTLLVRCYAYHRLVQHWLSGNLAKAWCYAHQIALKDPDDVIVLRARQWLEHAMTRLKREIPLWPGNRPPRRVYTRMVADLFHQGHIRFLQAARTLGTHLTVCVVSDERVLQNKGKLPVMSQPERAAVVAACKYVDAVTVETPDKVTAAFMRLHGFEVYTFACATERERADKYQLCEELPLGMIQELPYTAGISTTDLIKRILKDSESRKTP
ncbi:MAG: adenylyltransferase/cytidyltransferase family protein [Nitrosomonas sp.]|nr:MAG: adenylyltransferase/cytidyltransferase family protein [Nitrosomonas sp.]